MAQNAVVVSVVYTKNGKQVTFFFYHDANMNVVEV